MRLISALDINGNTSQYWQSKCSKKTQQSKRTKKTQRLACAKNIAILITRITR